MAAKKYVKWMIFGLAIYFAPGLSAAPQEGQNKVILDMKVHKINELSVSGNPGNLVIYADPDGFLPREVFDSSTAYGITTNETNKKITGEINDDLPPQTNLSIKLDPPSGASTEGFVPLSTVAKNLVVGISQVGENWKSISYSFRTFGPSTLLNTTRIVTLTMCDGE